jgi:flavin reductase (DIM6/NTAB) family NADH-FMN oxidoreductase RutF
MKIDPQGMRKRDLHELLLSAVLPRPIAFVSTTGEDGVFNLAPYSCFAPIGMKPPLVCMQIGWKRDGQKKDTLRNIEFSRDFVVNVVTEPLAKAMNQSAYEYPSHVDEFKEVGLTPSKSDLVKSPLLVESPVNMECKMLQITAFGGIPMGSNVIIGEIVLFHVKDDLWADDQIDASKLKAIGRLGGQLYCRTTDTFEMERPNAFEI